MINFDLGQFLIDRRLTIKELSKQINMLNKTLYSNRAIGRIKPATLRLMEEHYGSLSAYITKPRKRKTA